MSIEAAERTPGPGVPMPKGDFKFHASLRVRWMECDAQGIVYNGSYMDYLEVGQAEYYRNLGFSIYKIAERGYFDTAVVKVTLSSRPRPGWRICWTYTCEYPAWATAA